MEKVDRTHWERAELFEFFSAVSHPFYSVTFRVDVTNLYRYVKERHLSFYYAMGYLVTDAVNGVKNFRYAIRDGGVWLLDERIPSLTDLNPAVSSFTSSPCQKSAALRSFVPLHRREALPRRPFLIRTKRTTTSSISPAHRGLI